VNPPRLTALPPSLQKTFILVHLYLEKKSRTCFSYRGLRSWLHYNHVVKARLWQEWHTTERAIRKLVELEVLRRLRKGRKVIFCKGRYYMNLVVEYNHRIRRVKAQHPLDWLATP